MSAFPHSHNAHFKDEATFTPAVEPHKQFTSKLLHIHLGVYTYTVLNHEDLHY